MKVEAFLDELAKGEKRFRKICDERRIPYRMTVAWLESDPKMKALYDAALKMRGDELVEDGLEIVDKAKEANVGVQKARALYRLEMAKRWDKRGEAVGAAAGVDEGLVKEATELLKLVRKRAEEKVVSDG